VSGGSYSGSGSLATSQVSSPGYQYGAPPPSPGC